MNTSNTELDQGIPALSLQGGPLFSLGRRLGLVREQSNTVAIGLVVGGVLWIVLVVLALLEGVLKELFELQWIAGHVRLLIVIPLLFIAESALDPAVRAFIRSIVRPGIVPAEALPSLRAGIARLTRWKDSWVPDSICLLTAVVTTIAAPKLTFFGAFAFHDPEADTRELLLTGWWYGSVCLTIFRFLMLRWLWRLLLWWSVVWRVSRMRLELVATHGDRAAGLGYLEVVHGQFFPLIVGLSAIEAASCAGGIAAGAMAFEAVYPRVAIFLSAIAVLFIAPLFVPAPRLWRCRERGLSDFSVLATQYSRDFADRWLNKRTTADALLGAPDIQSLADMSNALGIMQKMRIAPVSTRLFIGYAVAVLLPMLPLLLLKYPIAELAQRLLQSISGL